MGNEKCFLCFYWDFLQVLTSAFDAITENRNMVVHDLYPYKI